MRRHRILFGLVALLLIAALIAPGCSQQAEPPANEGETGGETGPTEPAVSHDMKVRLPELGQSYDPAHTSSIMDSVIVNNVFNALVQFKEGTTEVIPDLAVEMPTVSDDHLTYTFKLRQGVQFHKGYGELTSEDVKFTFERILDPEEKAQNASQYQVIDSIDTPDDYTVVFHLKHADPTFLKKLANNRQGYIVCKTAVEELGADYSRNPVGTGPFVLDHWTEKTEVLLTANKDYWEGEPWLENITIVPIADETVAQMSLSKGETDIMIYVSTPDVLQSLQEDSNVTVSQVPSPGGDFLGINTRVEELSDVRVRQAMAHAINIDEYLSTVLGGLAVRAYGPLGPGMLGYTEDVTEYPYDTDKAKSLLAEAGYPDGFEVTLTIPGIDAFLIPFTAIQGYLQAVGITVNMDLVDPGAWIAAMGTGDVELTDFGFGARSDPEILFRQFLHSDAFPPGSNFMYYSGIDDLIDQGAATFDEDERAEIYAQAQQQFMKDLPAIPLSFLYETDAYRNDIKGFKPGVLFDYNFFEVHR